MNYEYPNRRKGRVRLTITDRTPDMLPAASMPRTDQTVSDVLQGLAQFNKALLRFLPDPQGTPANEVGRAQYEGQMESVQSQRDRLDAGRAAHQAKLVQDSLDAMASLSPLVFNADAWVRQAAKRVGVQETGTSPGIRYGGSPYAHALDGRPIKEDATVRLGDQ